MIHIVIVEDKKALAQSEEQCIRKAWNLKEEMTLRTYYSAEEFMRESPEELDILVLDIELPGMNGVELAKKVTNREKKVHIIFLTAHDGYALKSYQLEVEHYILKTEMEQRLPSILQKLGERVLRARVNYRILGTEDGAIKISYDEMMYFFKEGKYVRYVTEKGEYRERVSLDAVFREAGGFPFIKIERGFVINVRHLRSIQGDSVVMHNEEKLPISRRMMPNVKKTINVNWRNM